jgi:hypothetical protein
VGQLVRDQAAIPPEVGANKNGMVQGQTARCRRKKFHRNGRGPQHRMRWNWNCLDAKQADALRIFDTDFPGISQLTFGKRHSFTQGALPLFGHPLRGQRKELFQFFDRCLSIHAWLKSKNSAEQRRKMSLAAEIDCVLGRRIDSYRKRSPLTLEFNMTKAHSDHEALVELRYLGRKFLRFSKDLLRQPGRT